MKLEIVLASGFKISGKVTWDNRQECGKPDEKSWLSFVRLMSQLAVPVQNHLDRGEIQFI